jgi:hypothetical protein
MSGELRSYDGPLFFPLMLAAVILELYSIRSDFFDRFLEAVRACCK